MWIKYPIVESDDHRYWAPVVTSSHFAWLERPRSGLDYTSRVLGRNTGVIQDLSDVLSCDTDTVRLYSEWVIAELICPSEWNTIHAYHLETEEHIVIAPFSLDPLTQDFQPAVDAGNVIWLHADAMQRDIYMFNLESRIKSQITDDTEWENHPDISDDWVVWEDYALDIYAYNITTGERITVTHDAIPQQWPRIDGNLIVWEDERNGDWDIYGFDLFSRQEMALVTGVGDQTRGLPSGDILSYVNCPDQPLCYEAAAIHALNLETNETSIVHVFEDDEYYAPEQYLGDMVWIFDPSSGVNQVRFAEYLRNHLTLPIIFKDE